jgi:hypothetical protein
MKTAKEYRLDIEIKIETKRAKWIPVGVMSPEFRFSDIVTRRTSGQVIGKDK